MTPCGQMATMDSAPTLIATSLHPSPPPCNALEMGWNAFPINQNMAGDLTWKCLESFDTTQIPMETSLIPQPLVKIWG